MPDWRWSEKLRGTLRAGADGSSGDTWATWELGAGESGRSWSRGRVNRWHEGNWGKPERHKTIKTNKWNKHKSQNLPKTTQNDTEPDKKFPSSRRLFAKKLIFCSYRRFCSLVSSRWVQMGLSFTSQNKLRDQRRATHQQLFCSVRNWPTLRHGRVVGSQSAARRAQVSTGGQKIDQSYFLFFYFLCSLQILVTLMLILAFS